MSSIDESFIQRAIASHMHATRQVVCVPNCKPWWWECDLLAYDTRKNLATEIEVKVTRSDFFADANKPKFVHKHLRSGSGPNFFAYAVPKGLVEKDEVPDFAGLYVVDPDCRLGNKSCDGIESVKRCTRLRDKEIPPSRIAYVMRGLSLRYWEHRRDVAGEEGVTNG